jgi:hypothetical protein
MNSLQQNQSLKKTDLFLIYISHIYSLYFFKDLPPFLFTLFIYGFKSHKFCEVVSENSQGGSIETCVGRVEIISTGM